MGAYAHPRRIVRTPGPGCRLGSVSFRSRGGRVERRGSRRAMLVVLDGATIGQQIDDLDAGRFVGQARETRGDRGTARRPAAGERRAAARTGRDGQERVGARSGAAPPGSGAGRVLSSKAVTCRWEPTASTWRSARSVPRRTRCVAFDSWEHASPSDRVPAQPCAAAAPCGLGRDRAPNPPETSWVRDGWEHVTRGDRAGAVRRRRRARMCAALRRRRRRTARAHWSGGRRDHRSRSCSARASVRRGIRAVRCPTK